MAYRPCHARLPKGHESETHKTAWLLGHAAMHEPSTRRQAESAPEQIRV
jgi:hypothetical protein